MTPLHAAAIDYARRGWHVFPCAPNSKIPLIGKDQGGAAHRNATTNPAQIDAWWRACPDANVGISLAPSGLYVLDVDVGMKKDGTPKQGRASLAELDHLLPDTLTALTPRGGLHAIYTRPLELEPHRYIDFKPGLDLLGEGYIVAAPSVYVDFETGERGTYRWNREVAPVALPSVLSGIAQTRKTVEKVQLTGSKLPEGGRNIALYRLGAALRNQGIGAEALARALDAENQQRCNPPVDDTELGQIINNVLTRVTPTRDVAAGAIVEQEIKEIFAPATRAAWVGQVSKIAQPPMRFYATGFDELDTMIGGGVASRQVFGIIGPPSAGKSAFVSSLLMTLQKLVPVLLVSTELPREELFVRIAAHVMGFAWRDGMKGLIPREKMQEAVATLRIKIFGCDDLDRVDPLGSVQTEAIAVREETGLAPIIAVDYVQLLARGSEEKTRAKVGELTMRLRMMSQLLDCPVMAVFSTGRAFYGGKAADNMRNADDPTAYLAAAKESGDIEFDCATLVYLDVDKNHEGQPKPARIAVTRCRVGDIGFVGARAQLDVGRWWGDPSAAAEMKSEERASKHQEARLDKVCEKLIDCIVKMPGRPWREIKTATKFDYKLVDNARAKLLEEGKIELVTESYIDTLDRERKRDIIRVRDEASPTIVPE